MSSSSSINSNSGRRSRERLHSKRFKLLLTFIISLSLFSIYKIIFTNEALNHYNDNDNDNDNANAEFRIKKIKDQNTIHLKRATNNWRNPSAPIRSWSCNLNETPIIFVHIGKAGGGTIRRRFAAAAQNYTRSPTDWSKAHLDSHIYPFPTSRDNGGGGVRSASSSKEDGFDREPQGAKFCNSRFKHHRIKGTDYRLGTQFEGVVYCNATTPIGRMRACPEPLRDSCLGCDVNSKYCHTIYVGHNELGSEIHWLPPRVLQLWWKSQWGSLSNTLTDEVEHSKLVSDIEFGIETLLPGDSRWCVALEMGRPTVLERGRLGTRKDDFNRSTHLWTNCSDPLALITDGHFHEFWGKAGVGSTSDITKAEYRNYSPIYASLPVHRVTVIREPFSWLLSKFFWHKTKGLCDDIPSASLLTNITNASDGKQEWGWAYEYLVTYILYICGEDCLTRFEMGIMTLKDMEVQAESNLRQAFTVVGLFEEMDDFYDMVDQRFGYVNITASRIDVEDGQHSSVRDKNRDEVERCKKIFEKKDFRDEFKAHLSVLATMDRLYQVAVEVKRFQKEELSQCNSDL